MCGSSGTERVAAHHQSIFVINKRLAHETTAQPAWQPCKQTCCCLWLRLRLSSFVCWRRVGGGGRGWESSLPRTWPDANMKGGGGGQGRSCWLLHLLPFFPSSPTCSERVSPQLLLWWPGQEKKRRQFDDDNSSSYNLLLQDHNCTVLMLVPVQRFSTHFKTHPLSLPQHFPTLAPACFTVGFSVVLSSHLCWPDFGSRLGTCFSGVFLRLW